VVDTIAIRSDATTTLSKAEAESKYLLVVANVFELKGKHVGSLTRSSRVAPKIDLNSQRKS